MSGQRVEVVRRAIEAFNRHDFEGFAAQLAAEPEIVPLRAQLEGTSYTGSGAARAFWRASLEVWDQFRVDVEEMREGADCVLLVAVLRSRGRESGADTEVRTGWTATFEGDAIASLRMHSSVEKALETAG